MSLAIAIPTIEVTFSLFIPVKSVTRLLRLLRHCRFVVSGYPGMHRHCMDFNSEPGGEIE